MGALLDSSLMLAGEVTRRVGSALFNWIQLISGIVETNTTNIATLFLRPYTLQTKYVELAADTSFGPNTQIITTNITTTAAGGILEIDWSGCCRGDTASTFYQFWLKVDGVIVQSSRFTLDGASATFAFAWGGVKRITGVAPGVHTVAIFANPAGGTLAQFQITSNQDNCALLVKEVSA